ncbi:hypothetical protein V8E36_003114 [Tilletia maclaganii]
MADDLDLLDGDDDFWTLAETQLLASNPEPRQLTTTSKLPQRAHATFASSSKNVLPAKTPTTSAGVARQKSFGTFSAPATSRPNLQLNPKIGGVLRPVSAWANGTGRTLSSSAAAGPSASLSTNTGPSTSAFRQRNLFGEKVAETSGSARSRSTAAAGREPSGSTSRLHRASQSQNADGDNLTAQMTFRAQKVTKQWDFSQPVRKGKGKSSAKKGRKADKGKQRARDDDIDSNDDSDDAYFSETSDGAGGGMGSEDSDDEHASGSKAAETWIYPTNKSFRAYQYNIVQKALFNNVLVVLPTGLGKTFIAAVVILNFYRWFPQGKIIFVAPTKPLVSQQQIACHAICGLPWDQAIELTGSTKSRMRGDEWKSKRIFYITPQTFENDLMSSSCDPKDVVCLVVDEAHRARGNYAYGCVVRHIMRHNRHFRILALTATPGSKSEKVQEVIDSLHIGHIEIRSEDALDIRTYVHKKIETRIVVTPGPVLGPIQEALGIMMRTYLDQAIGSGVLRSGTDPKSLHPFYLRNMLKDKSKKQAFDAQPFLRSCIAELAVMADCMQTLTLYSVEMFRGKFHDAAAKASKAHVTKRKLYSMENKQFRAIIQLLEDAKDPKTNQVAHPKMVALLNTLQKHFSDHDVESEQVEIAHWTEGDGLHGRPPPKKRDTKAMVFCHFRESVTELVNYLNANGLKAISFVGQASTKGSRGCTQKQQEQIIRDFKMGKTNVIVATSIGEEGLDIGEVDLIVCHDAQKDPVRMLQRVGRTGRQRDGKIYVLLSEGKEEKNWQESKDSYKTVQKEINAGYTCELFDDVERLVPKHIQPKCIKETVEEHEFDPDSINLHIAPSRTAGKQRIAKKVKHPMRNIPKGSILGFLKASEVRQNPRSQPTKKELSDDGLFDDLDDDDEDDGYNWSIMAQIPTQKLQIPKQPPSSGDLAQDRRASHGAQSIIIPKPARWPPSPPPGTLSGTLSASTRSSHVHQDNELQPLFFSSGKSAPTQSPFSSSVADRALQTPSRRAAPHPLVAQMAAEAGLDALGLAQDGQGTARRQLGPIVDDDEDEEEEPPVRPGRGLRGHLIQPPMQPSSSSPVQQDMPAPARRRARPSVPEDAPTSGRSRLPKKRIGNSQTSRQLFAYEAERETDEEAHGDKDENDEGLDTDEADSSDLEHVGNFEPTQHPDQQYDQRSIYVQSLLTQTKLTPFKRASTSFGVGGYFGEGGVGRAGFDSRDNPAQEGSDDRYTQDSFVVGDDEEIEYED